MTHTGVAVGLRNFLVGRPEIQALVASKKIASDSNMPEGYIFEGKPLAVVDKLNDSTLIVISTSEPSSPPRPGSGFDHVLVHIDIWAAPKKTPGTKDVEEINADDNIRLVYSVIRPFVHLVGSSDSSYLWDGVKIAGSEISDGPDYRDVKNAEWHRMARISLDVTV